MSAKIEILKNEVWTELELDNSDNIKYNARINKIAETSNRQIGSTNTFSIPNTAANIRALGVNVFNPYSLATSLNKKYIAKYYVRNKLVQSGFLLINNTKGSINVNFIDESLDVVSRWGSITYKELLEDEDLPIENDYGTAIAELRNYSAPVNSVLSHLPEVGIRGYNLCLFPNNLNPIGESFQKNSDDIRVDDSFNPYQSRPLFNAMSLFDFACERFGYTGVFDESVDWATVKQTYFISGGNSESDKDDSGLLDVAHGINPWYDNMAQAVDSTQPLAFRYSKCLMRYPEAVSIAPVTLPNWVDTEFINGSNNYYNSNSNWVYKSLSYWNTKDVIFTPDLTNGNGGEIRFTADFTATDISTAINLVSLRVTSLWNPLVPGDDLVVTEYGNGAAPIEVDFPATITVGVDYALDITINKAFFNTIPAGASTPLGIMITTSAWLNGEEKMGLSNMQVFESSLTGDTIIFDDNDQYTNTTIDFSLNASRKTLKTLLTGVMHKEGILMNINDTTKVIKFFNYDHYGTQVEDGAYRDWSEYYVDDNKLEWKTNYGNNYGRINEISLSSPYRGNSFIYTLSNQGELSRYKDKAQDEVSKFKDVEGVSDIGNTLNAYTEYTSKGLGLVELRGTISGDLNQVRYDSAYTSPGAITDLPLIANVNYATIPIGVEKWYQLIDRAVRVKPKFLLPISEIRNLDLSEPIYVDKLGGFYIIEEVSEYVSPSALTSVSLIKLIDE
tara:strand:+ start:1764 stop:3953 length:2190 start_codon:yes stop_codon:yes gene_type:complete